MDSFLTMMNNFLHKYFTSEKKIAPEINRINIYINGMYKLLSWEDPIHSWKFLGVVHLFLWIVLQLRLRLFSIISILVLTFFLYDAYFERSGVILDDNKPIQYTSYFLKNGREFLTNIQHVRKTNPKKFCATFSGIFIFLLILSLNISGFLLVYTLIMSAFLMPLLLSKIPPEYLTPIKIALQKLQSDEGTITEAELLPVMMEKDLDSLLTDKSQDSFTNSFMGGLTSMPSHLDIEESLDDLDDDLEIPVKFSKTETAVSCTPGDLSTDSDSDHKGINFQSSHFNGDSSSEDDDKKYTDGLQFSEDTMDVPDKAKSTNDVQNTASSSVFYNILSAGQNVFSNALGKKESVKRQDSDSDYEFINSEDIQ